MMKRTTLITLSLLVFALSSLSALTVSGNTGFTIPVGTWAEHHSPSAYLSFGLQMYQKSHFSLGLALEMTTFRGKLNSDYHLQVVSPGIALNLYPLFFIDKQSLFLRETLSYSFMQRNVHDATEKGRDIGILSALGFEFSLGDRWGIVPYFGEKHYLGGIDMLLIGLEIAYKR
jgi:hypothetical protein